MTPYNDTQPCITPLVEPLLKKADEEVQRSSEAMAQGRKRPVIFVNLSGPEAFAAEAPKKRFKKADTGTLSSNVALDNHLRLVPTAKDWSRRWLVNNDFGTTTLHLLSCTPWDLGPEGQHLKPTGTLLGYAWELAALRDIFYPQTLVYNFIRNFRNHLFFSLYELLKDQFPSFPWREIRNKLRDILGWSCKWFSVQRQRARWTNEFIRRLLPFWGPDVVELAFAYPFPEPCYEDDCEPLVTQLRGSKYVPRRPPLDNIWSPFQMLKALVPELRCPAVPQHQAQFNENLVRMYQQMAKAPPPTAMPGGNIDQGASATLQISRDSNIPAAKTVPDSNTTTTALSESQTTALLLSPDVDQALSKFHDEFEQLSSPLSESLEFWRRESRKGFPGDWKLNPDPRGPAEMILSTPLSESLETWRRESRTGLPKTWAPIQDPSGPVEMKSSRAADTAPLANCTLQPNIINLNDASRHVPQSNVPELSFKLRVDIPFIPETGEARPAGPLRYLIRSEARGAAKKQAKLRALASSENDNRRRCVRFSTAPSSVTPIT